MHTPQDHLRPAAAEMVSNLVGAVRHCRHDRDAHEVEMFIERQTIDRFIDEYDFMFGWRQCRNSHATEAREPKGSYFFLGESQARIRILWRNQKNAHGPLPFPLHH